MREADVVTRKRFACLCLTLTILSITLFSTYMPPVKAQSVTYTVSQEWAKVQVNQDSWIYVLYNITFAYLSGSPQGIFTVAMPKGGFQVQYVQDLSGSSLQYQDSSQGSFYGIDVYLNKSVVINQPYTFIVYARVPNMISLDSSNPGNLACSSTRLRFPAPAFQYRTSALKSCFLLAYKTTR